MIKLISNENVTGTYDNKKIDWDRYDIEIRSPFSTKEYSIVVDFLEEGITGDCIAFGGWFDIEEKECIELLKIVFKNNQPLRDCSHIIEKYKGVF